MQAAGTVILMDTKNMSLTVSMWITVLARSVFGQLQTVMAVMAYMWMILV